MAFNISPLAIHEDDDLPAVESIFSDPYFTGTGPLERLKKFRLCSLIDSTLLSRDEQSSTYLGPALQDLGSYAAFPDFSIHGDDVSFHGRGPTGPVHPITKYGDGLRVLKHWPSDIARRQWIRWHQYMKHFKADHWHLPFARVFYSPVWVSLRGHRCSGSFLETMNTWELNVLKYYDSDINSEGENSVSTEELVLSLLTDEDWCDTATSSDFDDLPLENLIPRPCRTRPYSGHSLVHDVLAGHPNRGYDMFRLDNTTFFRLRDLLVDRGALKPTRHVTVNEQLAIFLHGIAHAQPNRVLAEIFQHSGETISRHFNSVLEAILTLKQEYIQLPPPNAVVHPVIEANESFKPFKHALGAIDGSHVIAHVSKEKANRYRCRKGFTSQNVMAACSFDHTFLYVCAGWEGSASDMKVLRWCLETHRFSVPNGYENGPGLDTYLGEREKERTIRNGKDWPAVLRPAGRWCVPPISEKWKGQKSVVFRRRAHSLYTVEESYTEKNLMFAATIEPGNEKLLQKLSWAHKRREENLPTIPSTIGEEFETNPFMRVDLAEIQAKVGCSSPVEAIKEIRRLKDNWRGK